MSTVEVRMLYRGGFVDHKKVTRAALLRNHLIRGLTTMDNQAKHSRRKILKVGVTALAAIPLAGFPHLASAAQNAAIRKALKFQEQPNGDKQCSKCVNFVPNKDKPGNNDDVNGCKLYPGDTEIPPQGYCTGFVANPASAH
jgi:hypothetical protein